MQRVGALGAVGWRGSRNVPPNDTPWYLIPFQNLKIELKIEILQIFLSFDV